MKEVFNKATNSMIFSSIIALIIGIIMVIFPKISIETIGIIAAIYIIIHGIVLIVLDIKATRFYIPFDGLLSGILSILIGILFLSKPNILPTIFTLVIGIWIILSSINYIRIALKLTKTELPWGMVLLLGLLELIIGLILVLNPFESTISLMLFSGIMIIIYSIINIIDTIIIKKEAKEISKELETYLQETAKETK